MQLFTSVVRCILVDDNIFLVCFLYSPLLVYRNAAGSTNWTRCICKKKKRKKKRDMKLQRRCESDLGDFENGKGVHMNHEILKE